MVPLGFGGRVREIRQRLGLSLKDLADRAGLDKGYLSQIETEKRPNPSVHLARRIADALAVDLGALMDGLEGGATAEGAVVLPPALATYVALREEQGRPLGAGVVEDLRRIQFRGEYPSEPQQYEILVNQLEMFTRKPEAES
jgi:transcriptional regulator with XRE-family HTH domain